MMRIAPAPGGELGLRVTSVEESVSHDLVHTYVMYRGGVTVDGFRFNANVIVGGYMIEEWCPNRTFAAIELDKSDPAVEEAVQRAANRALARGFRAVRPYIKYAFECPVCRKDRAHIEKFRTALLLLKSAGIYVHSTITVGTRSGRERAPITAYDLCLIHGDQINREQDISDDLA